MVSILGQPQSQQELFQSCSQLTLAYGVYIRTTSLSAGALSILFPADISLFVFLPIAGISVFKPSSFHIMLQTSFGLQVQIQLVPIMQVYVTLDESYKSKTQGKLTPKL